MIFPECFRGPLKTLWRATWPLIGHACTKQSTSRPNLNLKRYKSVEFLSIFQCQAPLHKRKVPLLKTFWLRFCVSLMLNALQNHCCVQVFVSTNINALTKRIDGHEDFHVCGCNTNLPVA